MNSAAYGPTHQSGFFERFDVLGGCRQRHREWLRQLAYGTLLRRQAPQHRPASGVAEGAKHVIQARRILNHMVNIRGNLGFCQPYG